MYETFFGLKRRPFLFVPDVESYFVIESAEETRQKIEHTLQKGEGISLIFGSSGTGKTLLLQILRRSLKADYDVVLVSNSRLETPRDLILQLFHDLRIPFASVETIKLRSQLLDSVQQKPGQGVILLFDDAQYIAPSVLEEIRLLADPADGSTPPFRVALAGTMDFEEKLAISNLESFNQRIVSRCYLDSFSREETFRYIARQTDNLRIDPPHGTSSPLFTEEAKQRIYQLTDGVPRLINQLCGTALQFAETRKIRSVDGALINDAWTSLQHIDFVQLNTESESKTEQVHSVAQVTVVSSDPIEEIIDRKKKTFQLRQFDPIEFGILTDSDAAETEVPVTNRLVDENEYKPPYPEDDDEYAEFEEPEPEVYRLPCVLDKTPSVLAEVVVPKCISVHNRFNKQHRKFRRRYLLEKIQHRLGLFVGVLQKIESTVSVPSPSESNMNEKSLQEYGAKVLGGRPPFVRKEPHYAYQTTDTAPQKDVTYPDPKTGAPITLRWLPEKVDAPERFGVSYTEFLNRAEGTKRVEPEKNVVPTKESGMEYSVTPVPSTPIVRTSLNASLGSSTVFSLCSGLEESFEESQQVSGLAISLAELFQVDSRRIAESAEFKSLDESIQQQLAVILQRITKAAEKIEQAADVSERAGKHVAKAAEFVETKVKAALPTYTDLFQQWSEFQNLISAELESVRQHYVEPSLKTFPPRRQIMIERTVSSINVEALLK